MTAQQGGKSRGKVLGLNIVYTAGLIAVFLVLATLSAFLNFGWGQQFTQMWFKLTLLVMTFAFGLSFLGVWEIPIPGFAGSGKADELQRQVEPRASGCLRSVYDHVLRAQDRPLGQGADQGNQRAYCASAERHGKYDDDLPDQQLTLSLGQRLRGDPGGRRGD